MNLVFAFSAMGKTILSNKYENVIDLETLKFEWIYDPIAKNWCDEKLKGRDDIRKRNPQFPYNYVDYLESIVDGNIYIFCPTNELVVDELIRRGYKYIAVFPNEEAFKKYYINRFRERGNSETFVKILCTNYQHYVDILKKGSKINIEVTNDGYLSDYFDVIKQCKI